MKKYLKFLEDMHDGEKLIWKKDSLYQVIYSDPDVYYVGAESDLGNYGIDTKSENKKFIIVEKD